MCHEDGLSSPIHLWCKVAGYELKADPLPTTANNTFLLPSPELLDKSWI
jgi:hypothetical protein